MRSLASSKSLNLASEAIKDVLGRNGVGWELQITVASKNDENIFFSSDVCDSGWGWLSLLNFKSHLSPVVQD